MANRWFRIYDEVLDDPKVQRLPPVIFKTWINVLCAASRHSGAVPNLQDLAFMLRRDEAELADEIDQLVTAGLIDDFDGNATPHNWNGRQFQSDTSTERVQRYRNKATKQGRNVSETVDETPPDTESDTEQNRVIDHPSDGPANNKIDAAKTSLEIYNTTANECGWPVAQRLTKQRQTALLSRLRECGGEEGWRAAIDKAKASQFLRGGNDKGWLPDLDFFCQSKSFTKLMEGSYDDRTPGTNSNGKQHASETIRRSIARVVENRARMGSGEARADERPPPHGSEPQTSSGVADDIEIPVALRRY